MEGNENITMSWL